MMIGAGVDVVGEGIEKSDGEEETTITIHTEHWRTTSITVAANNQTIDMHACKLYGHM